jgi:2-oxoglutarate ferredoxin oxidoreductase subunit alpha
MLHFSEIWPFPLRERFDYVKLLEDARLTISVEHNATGQFERLLRTETGYRVNQRINKFDGRPFTVDELSDRILEILG